MDIKEEIKNICKLAFWICTYFYCIPLIIISFITIVSYYFLYDFIKEKFFPHFHYIPYYKDQSEEIKKWVRKNIKGPKIIENVFTIDHYSDPFYGDCYLVGWNYRFMRQSDYFAFKLVWSSL